VEYITEDGCEDLQIAYIGGGSRGWTWGFMTDLAMDPQISGMVRLYDIDRKAAECNRIIGEKIARDPRVRSSWRYEVSAVYPLSCLFTGATLPACIFLSASAKTACNSYRVVLGRAGRADIAS